MNICQECYTAAMDSIAAGSRVERQCIFVDWYMRYDCCFIERVKLALA
jgi:hypothetical protein